MDHTEFMLEGDNDAKQALKQIVRICKKGRWLIAFGSLIAVVVTTVGLTFLPSKYRSDATILIAEQEISASVVTPLSTVTAAQKLQAMEQEILSQSRLQEIIAQFNLFPDQKDLSPDAAVTLMRAAIDIAPIDPKLDQFSAFSISFTAGTPELAQDVNKKLCSVFISRNKEKQENRVKLTNDFIQQQMTEKHSRLTTLDERMQAFKTQHAGELPEDRATNEGRLQDARSQFETAAANLNRAKQQRTIWETAFTRELDTRLTRLKAEREALLKNYTPQHHEVVAKDEQIAQFQAALEGVKSGAPLPQSVIASLDSNILQLQGQLQANALEIDTLNHEETRWTGRIAEYERKLNSTANWEQQLAGMVRESGELAADVAEVQKKQQQTGMSVEAEKHQEGGQFKQLDPPSLPDRPSSPPRLKISLAAAVVGALLGLGLAFLLDLQNAAFHSEEELRERFAPPLLLSVPVLLTRNERRAKAWRIAFESVGASFVTIAIIAVELYVFRHP